MEFVLLCILVAVGSVLLFFLAAMWLWSAFYLIGTFDGREDWDLDGDDEN